jgi:hypothetical protein
VSFEARTFRGLSAAGKTTALRYLAAELGAEKHPVVMVRLAEIGSGDQLKVSIVCTLFDQARGHAEPPEFEALDQIRAQFQDHFTASQKVSELSYEEVISDFRAATGFVRNCRAGKIVEFEPEKVKTLFDEKEGWVVLQLERLERLGFLSRTIVKEGDALLPRFHIPRLFTRCWETSA